MPEPVYLHGYRAICKACGIGETTFKRMIKKGAPIRKVLVGETHKHRYKAEKHELMAWILKNG